MSPSRTEEINSLYRIGVDVGGTNTDSALARAIIPTASTAPSDLDVSIIASIKTPTTPDVTTGICTSIRGLLAQSAIERSAILSVNIGTTHFINAIVQKDSTKLARVAVLRLCGPFCREVPPFADFPTGLRRVVEGPVGYLYGGLEIDGRIISNINEAEIAEQAERIEAAGVSAVVVVGVFSPLDTAEVTQEESVKAMLLKRLPYLDIVCSKDIGNIGLIERENASILNASILRFGRKTIAGFQRAIAELGLQCALYLTQNDGTIMSIQAASATPIKTFSSGATNSLAGAIFLSGIHTEGSGVALHDSQIMMVDIGGTTSDFASLSPTGFPRQSPAVVKVGGVRTAFQMPEVLSIGLGGGSRIDELDDGTVKVGPDSVGFRLETESRCFGGSTLTATDIVVAAGGEDDIGAVWETPPSADLVGKARRDIKKQLEKGVDAMKASDAKVTVLLVGGGAIVQMDDLQGVYRCIRPPFYTVANAVGAAIAKISGEIDCIKIPGDVKREKMIEDLKAQAIQVAHQNGAKLDSIKIVELELIPLQYVSNGAIRAIVKAVGSAAWSRTSSKMHQLLDEIPPEVVKNRCITEFPAGKSTIDVLLDADLESYTPKVSKATGEWYVSEIDLAFIAEGCGVLGTGGGGSSYTAHLNSVDVLRSVKEGRMRIIDPVVLPSESQVATVAMVGSPSVANERLLGEDELLSASQTLAKYLGIQGFDAVLSAEIGGGNGMRAFALGAAMDIPVVDGDTMGRAFPNIDMSLPYVYGKSQPCPAVLSDARGNVQVIAGVEDHHRLERMIRSACLELGISTALSFNPLTGRVIHDFCCHRGLSSAWFIGRAICLARVKKSDPVIGVISQLRGSMQIYSGKIIDISREVRGGWTVGTATIETNKEEEGEGYTSGEAPRPMILQYQNEFLFAALQNPDKSLEVIVTTPDLISMLDQDGTPLGTQELRYGLRVSVIAMPADPLWMTDEGMTAAGPAAFGLDFKYVPFPNRFEKSRSVIEEYAT